MVKLEGIDRLLMLKKGARDSEKGVLLTHETTGCGPLEGEEGGLGGLSVPLVLRAFLMYFTTFRQRFISALFLCLRRPSPKREFGTWHPTYLEGSML